MSAETKIEIDETLTITGTYYPAERERGPTYGCGGEPEVPAMWEDVQVVVAGISMTMTPEVTQWAVEKLEDNRREND